MTLFKDTKLVAAEDVALTKLQEAFETSHKRHLVDRDDEELIFADDGANLSAVCRSARLCWAYVLCEELAAHFDYDVANRSINQPVFLFTLVDVQCARPSSQFGVDLTPIVRRLRKGLRGCNYIGAIEPGLYSHISVIGANLQQGRCVSWHLHALVWGMTRKDAKQLAAKLNSTKNYIPISPGQAGAHQVQVREGEFAETFAYLLKRPKYAYRLGLRRDPVTAGEPTHIQYRDPVRPGECLDGYLQMKHLSLPDVWSAEGEGRKILANVKRHCWSAFRRYERLSRAKRKYRGSSKPRFLS